MHNAPVPGRPDSEDVIKQAGLVSGALDALGFDWKVFQVGSPTGSGGASFKGSNGSMGQEVFFLLFELKRYAPAVVFNLIEDTPEWNIRQHYFTMLFEMFDYNFTGSGHEAILTTTDKALAKFIMMRFGIPTPRYQVYHGSMDRPAVPPPWIVKPSLEDASVGIDDTSVFREEAELLWALPGIYETHGRQPLLVENFLEGREFNISLFETPDGGVEVLPVAEMLFDGWPAGKPKIVGYRAKWDEESFESRHTVRSFNPPRAPLERLRDMALKCWKVFDLNGYARVDIRMDGGGEAFVMEVNANPCISPEAGFLAAAKEAGFGEKEVVDGILRAAFSKTARAA